MASSFEQAVAFGTDIVGLERFFRFVESVFMILVSYPSLLASLMPLSPPSVHMSTMTSLRQLQGRLSVTRRSMRLFRFLESFNVGWKLYAAPGAITEKGIEAWLDIFGKSCLGMFLMLESATLPDLMGVDHVEFFGPSRTKELNLQAQMFWFLGLYASIVNTCIKLVRILAYSPVPQTGGGYGAGDETSEKQSSAVVSEKGGQDSLENEQEALKAAAEKRKEARKAWAKEVSDKTFSLGIKLVSDVLDLVLPATAVGWIHVHRGLLGVAMLCSTLTTSMDVWHRCGRQIRGA